MLATAAAVVAMLALASPAAAEPFGLLDFDGNALLSNGEPATQAGSRPHTASTTFHLTTAPTSPNGSTYASEDPKDVVVDLPPGLVGNPNAVAKCTETELQGSIPLATDECPANSQIGVLSLALAGPSYGSQAHAALYNMEAPRGTAALLGFNVAGTVIHLVAKVRSGSDYGITVSALNNPNGLPFHGATATVWGVPGDSSFDQDRGRAGGSVCVQTSNPACSNSFVGTVKPFFTLPTSCTGPARTDLTVTSWLGSRASGSFLTHDNTTPTPNPIGNDGCNALDFSPSLKARPTTNVADSPTGLDVELHIPQNEDPDGNAEAHLKDTTVTLPEGVAINPSAANGLDGCSPAQIGLTSAAGVTPITYTPDAAQCPDASKLGTVEVDTPLLDHPILGSVYIATPYKNPFDSLLSIYLAIDDPESGVVVKLAGEVRADPVTGQLRTTFNENPQVPFEDFRLRFFGGAGGSLRTPSTCGTYTTTSSLTPWSAPDSGPPATPSDSWAIEKGPGDTCATSEASLPNKPSFDAGTASPISGTYSPLVVNLRRDDGSQRFSSLTLTPPQGLIGKLAGVPYCPEEALAAARAKSGSAEKATPSCPSASEVGSVTAAAGAGPAPYYASGKAYLTGPYKGAPLSLAIVTPATAGPFDLGTIVVKTALYVDSKTARITAVSDPIPSILQGIPLSVRSVQVKIDRPDFTMNPTSCEPMAFGGEVLSTLGQVAPLSSHFQVGECERLGFKPQISLRLKGGTRRGSYPALTAVLRSRPGDANLANISVALPHSEFLAQEHIRTICTRVQFAADQCPAAAIYGTATVTTPLLDYPLTGPVYLRSSDNPLPDLVPDLRGPAHQPLKLESAGRTDSIRGGIRNSFDFIPDAPFSTFVLKMQGGKKGLLVNSRDICQTKNRATIKFGAHNGATLVTRPLLKAKCPKKARKHSKAGKHRAVGHGAR